MKSFLILSILFIIYQHVNYGGASSEEIHLESNASSGDVNKDPVPILYAADQLPKYEDWVVKTKVTGEEEILSLFYRAVEDLSQLKEECVINEALALESWKALLQSKIENVAAIEKIKKSIKDEYDSFTKNYAGYRHAFTWFDKGPDCYLEGSYTPTDDMYTRYAYSFEDVNKKLEAHKQLRNKLEAYFNERIEKMETILNSFDYHGRILGDLFMKKLLSATGTENYPSPTSFEELFKAFAIPQFDLDRKILLPIPQGSEADNPNLNQETVEMEPNVTENAVDQSTSDNNEYLQEIMGLVSQVGMQMLSHGIAKFEMLGEFVENFLLDQIENTELAKSGDDDLVNVLLKCLQYFRKGFDRKDKEIDNYEDNVMFAMARQKVRVISAFFSKIISQYDKSSEKMKIYIVDTVGFMDTTVKSLKEILPKPCDGTASRKTVKE